MYTFFSYQFQGEHHLFAETPDIRRRAMNEAVLWITSRCDSNTKGLVNIVDVCEVE